MPAAMGKTPQLTQAM